MGQKNVQALLWKAQSKKSNMANKNMTWEQMYDFLNCGCNVVVPYSVVSRKILHLRNYISITNFWGELCLLVWS